MNGIDALEKHPTELPNPLLLCEETTRNVQSSPDHAGSLWSGTSSFQNCEKLISVVYKPPGL